MKYSRPTIEAIDVTAYDVPTDHPEADGTLAWNSTVLIVVRMTAGGREGLGWTYASYGAADVVRENLSACCIGQSALDAPGLNERMTRTCRNLGRPGLVACAISAVDIAAWDLKARLLDVSLTGLFGQVREEVPIYGSGGFTTYDDHLAAAQLELWTDTWALSQVKIKIGESWGAAAKRDVARIAFARSVIGENVQLFVDANGGYRRKQAIRMAREFYEDYDVTWFEEPVSSDDLPGLREVKASSACDVAAGEYGYTLSYFQTMITAQAVDCLQIDVTRCGGYSVWLQAAALAAAHNMDVSGHCAPNLHAHVATSIPNLRHLEYFHDHHRIETMLFDGTLEPFGGALVPRADTPGHGLQLREAEASKFRIR